MQQAAAGGSLRCALSSPGTVPPLCPRGAAPKAGHQSRTPQGRQPGRERGVGGTPVRCCTSHALACLRMQPVSPWQLGMLPSPGPAGSHLPSRHVELIEGLNRGPPSPSPASPLPRAQFDPVHRQCCFLQAFFSHQNHRLGADCSKILPMGKQGRAQHSSPWNIIHGPEQGCPARGQIREHRLWQWGAPAGGEPILCG